MSVKVLNRFPGANVRVLELRTRDGAPEVVFAADPKGGAEALWFNFRVEESEPERAAHETLVLTLAFFGNLRGADNPQVCRPVIREPGKPWNRLKSPQETRLTDGQLLLSWTIAYPVAPVEIALCYPYDRDDLAALRKHCKGYWSENPIGLTQQGRPLTRLDNGVRGGAESATQPKGLYVVARRHAGETPGSWVLDGLLSAFSRARSPAWCVWAVPFANPDGVVAGEYGRAPGPHAPDRAGEGVPRRHETLVLEHDLRRWAAQCRAELVLDLHAPGACETAGLSACLPTAEEDSAWRHGCSAWANVLAQGLGREYAAAEFARTAESEGRWEAPPLGPFVRDRLRCPVVTIEAPYAFCGDLLMTPKQYREAGQRLARAILMRR